MVFFSFTGYIRSFVNIITELWDQYKIHDDKVYVVCKIVDSELFNKYFPVLNTKYRTQPSWDFYENKGIIKIEIDEINKNNYNEILDSTDLDIPFLKSFSEIFIYIHYKYEHKQYINVYKNGESINDDDFIVKETELSKKYTNVYASFLDIYGYDHFITEYFKMFLNNKNEITPEILLNNYDKIDNPEIKLCIFDGSDKMKSLKETIYLLKETI